MSTFLLGLCLFFGIHSVRIISPSAYTALVKKFGAMPWKGIYSLVAIAGFVLMVHGWPEARANAVILWQPPTWTRHVAMLLMLPVLPMLLAAYLPGKIKSTLKHPMLVATKLWALAHLLSNGQLHEVLLFGGFLAWAVLCRISIKHRQGLVPPAPSAWTAKDGIAMVVGLGLYGWFVMQGHGLLLGMPLIAPR
jgi:uncharacterized membrane protein